MRSTSPDAATAWEPRRVADARRALREPPAREAARGRRRQSGA